VSKPKINNATEETLQEICSRAFAKAKAGGWNPEETEIIAIAFDGSVVPLVSLLMSHNFAQGLWGTEMVNENGQKSKRGNDVQSIWQPAWRYHFKRMMMDEDPLFYLMENA